MFLSDYKQKISQVILIKNYSSSLMRNIIRIIHIISHDIHVSFT